jgi:hypothetical protein
MVLISEVCQSQQTFHILKELAACRFHDILPGKTSEFSTDESDQYRQMISVTAASVGMRQIQLNILTSI